MCSFQSTSRNCFLNPASLTGASFVTPNANTTFFAKDITKFMGESANLLKRALRCPLDYITF